MNKTIKKSDQAKIIRSTFSAIKKNNLEKFEELINEHSWLLNFKNNKREGLLFYAFDCNSDKIVNSILERKPELISEKNILNMNIIHELILKNKNIDLFLKKMVLLDEKTKKQIYINKDPQGNNLILLSSKVGNVENLNKIIKLCPNFEEIKTHSNNYGQNIAHFVVANVHSDFREFAFKLDVNLLRQIDNINGLSALMLAAYQQSVENFSYLFELSPKEQSSLLDNKLLHFAANNKDHLVADYLIENNLFTNKKNKFNQTPLQIALSKGLQNVSEIIFKQAKKYGVNADEIILSPKISLVNPILFNKILNNEKSITLSTEEKNKFLENLFLYSNENTIKELYGSEKYNFWFENINFSKLFLKTVVGKKEMALKTNFLLKDKILLTEEEAILACESLEKIPASQIVFLFRNSELLSKISEDHKVLFVALSLAKGIDYFNTIENIKNNDSDEVQKYIKQSLKGNKIENSTKHIKNIEMWLKIFKDKKIVLKHYGNIIAKHIHPFHYLDNSFKVLGKENKKELVYYTITSLFKKDVSISMESLNLISRHPNLLSSVYAGVIKYGKIPCNQDLLGLLEKSNHNFLSAEDLIFFLNKSAKKTNEAINLVNKTINLFNFDKIDIKDLCFALEKHKDHSLILEKILSKIKMEDKENFVLEYLNSYVKNEFKINEELLIKLAVEHKNKSTINAFFESLIFKDDYGNIEFINKIVKTKKISSDINMFFQDLFNNESFFACSKLMLVLNEQICFTKIDFTKIDWNKIDIEICSYSNDDKLFDFISENGDRLSEKQVNQIIDSLVKVINSNISIVTIDKVLTALEKNIQKIEVDSLVEISNYMLKKYLIDNPTNKVMTEENLNHYFNLMVERKNGLFLKSIQENENYSLINKDIRTTINKEILNEYLLFKKETKPKKTNKI